MPQAIVEDFAAIHARMLAIRAGAPPEPAPQPSQPKVAEPQDFHSWLMSGSLWLP